MKKVLFVLAMVLSVTACEKEADKQTTTVDATTTSDASPAVDATTAVTPDVTVAEDATAVSVPDDASMSTK